MMNKQTKLIPVYHTQLFSKQNQVKLSIPQNIKKANIAQNDIEEIIFQEQENEFGSFRKKIIQERVASKKENLDLH